MSHGETSPRAGQLQKTRVLKTGSLMSTSGLLLLVWVSLRVDGCRWQLVTALSEVGSSPRSGMGWASMNHNGGSPGKSLRRFLLEAAAGLPSAVPVARAGGRGPPPSSPIAFSKTNHCAWCTSVQCSELNKFYPPVCSLLMLPSGSV